jgi:rubrerythrin
MEPWQQERVIRTLQEAIVKEKEGQALYRNLASGTQNPQGKEMFQFLVRDEQSHIDKLEAQINSLRGGSCIDPLTWEKEDRPRNRESFLARAQEEMVPKMKGDFTDLDAMKLALDMENKGYTFYEKAAAEAVDSMVKGVFQYLMGQEKQHRELLTNTLVYLEAPLEWFGREERHIFDQ